MILRNLYGQNSTRNWLARSFNNESIANEYKEIRVVYRPEGSLDSRISAFNERIRKRLDFLQSTLDKLRLIPEEPEPRTKSAVPGSNLGRLGSKNIFLVHGHDEGVNSAVARFIERLGLNVAILREQPDKGRTIIEKVEQHSDVGFVVVLLTPDDVGASRTNAGQLRPRGRQNVIFEMGFFAGKLGRSKVAVLHSEGVEIPSDYQGVLYIQIDSRDAWKLRLAKEFRAAGIPVDMNKID